MSTLQRTIAVVDLVHRWEPDDDDLAAALVTVLEEHGEHDVRLTDEDVNGLSEVAARLREVLASTDRHDAATRLNDLLATHAARPRLVCHEGWDWHLHVDSADDAPWGEWLASSAALALATLLARSPDLPWGVCAADGCGRVYVHDGRGARRRYCSTTCSTRVRVRRHRAGGAFIGAPSNRADNPS